MLWYCYNMTTTESLAGPHPDLDLYDAQRLVHALAADHQGALDAVLFAAPAIARAVEDALPRLTRGGRLVYAGAGTSGRLALLDAVELGPTFSWPAERRLACMAGGVSAFINAVENAEDNGGAGRVDMRALSIGADDVAIVVAASGRTPYALGALAEAREAGSLCIGISNNADTPLLRDADIGICLLTGPEVVAGSTRLKAGTAQKIALNTLSTALMVRMHKTHGHLMVDLQVTNAKLRERAVGLVGTLVGCDLNIARQALADSGWRVKTAVLVARRGLESGSAQLLLDACGGWLRQALDAPVQTAAAHAPSGASR
jgi:N-acetylmuramic acid 6-phosphate etherase